jgi:pimeloyl-ACP methyl ester carboxylesterase
MPMLEAHGCRLEYEWFGERVSGRPALVFLHQGLGSIAQWRDFPAKLAAATGCAAFAYNREGHGGSDGCAWPRPFDFMEIEGRDRLPEVLKVAGIDDFILVGHSDGGTIALVYAAEVKTGMRGVIVEGFHVFAEEVVRAGIRRSQEAYVNGDLREKLARYHGDNVDCAFHGWAETWLLPEMKDYSIAPLIPKIEAPILAILGTEDAYGTMEQIDCLPRLARAPLEISKPDCGHSPHEEVEPEMLALMAGFVARLQEPAQSP